MHKTAESNRQMPINLLFKNYKTDLYEDVVISKAFTKRRLIKFVVWLPLNRRPTRASLDPSICRIMSK